MIVKMIMLSQRAHREHAEYRRIKKLFDECDPNDSVRASLEQQADELCEVWMATREEMQALEMQALEEQAA